MSQKNRLLKARTAQIQSKSGPCENCKRKGYVRYFVAAKLPRFQYLCDEHYLRIRNRLEKALEKILLKEADML